MSEHQIDPALQELAIKREGALNEVFIQFSRRWEKVHQAEVFLNRAILLAVTQEYYKDINRKKKDHEIVYADCHKRAAYTVRWLLKLRPIQFKGMHPPADLILANEEFAFYVACGFLEIQSTKIPKKLYDHCVHHFRKSDYLADSWACLFYLMEACGKLDLLESIQEYFNKKLA